MLLVVGILFGLLSGKYEEVHVYAYIVEADPHLILTVFLPVLLFESAFAMEVHTFIKTFIQVVLLAIPGLGEYRNSHSPYITIISPAEHIALANI